MWPGVAGEVGGVRAGPRSSCSSSRRDATRRQQQSMVPAHRPFLRVSGSPFGVHTGNCAALTAPKGREARS